MVESFRMDYGSALGELRRRIREPAPSRIQLLFGPRQVGKTTLLLELARELAPRAIYAAADGPEAALPGFWEGLWARAAQKRPAVLLPDEIQHVHDWPARIKGDWDRLRRERRPVHVVATGSSVCKRHEAPIRGRRAARGAAAS